MGATRSHLQVLVHTILACALGAPAAAHAVEAEAQRATLQEVVVTATRRAENIQNIPMAVTALSSEFRDKIRMEGAQDIANFTPGLQARDEPDERLNIRGVGRTTNAPGSDPGVGVYQDGVYTSSTRPLAQSSLMNDRIEILRGPQGTLYGRNTIGGAVNVISRRPSDEWSGEARASYGNFNATMLGAAFSGPVSDRVGVRFDAVKQDRDGYIKNLGPGNDLADLDAFDASAQFDWQITERLNLWVRYLYTEYDQAPDFRVLREQWPNNIFHEGLVVHPWYGYTEENPAINDPWRIRQDENQSLSNDTNTVTAHLAYEADGFTVKYIGGYNDWDWAMHYDGDGIAQTQEVSFVDLAGNPWSVPVQGTVDQLQVKDFQSHEIQVLSDTEGQFDWVAGLYYYQETTDGSWDWRTPNNAWLQNAYLDGTQVNWWETGTVSIPNPEARGWYEGGTLDATSYAVYGQAGYEINERWKINAGLRYSEDEKTGWEFQQWWWMPQAWWLGPNGTLYSLLNPVTGEYEAASITGGMGRDKHEADWSATTGLLSVEYRPNDRTMWYLSASQGNKSGGFLLGALANRPDTPQDDGLVKPEDLLAFEVGYKADITDHFRLNAAAYWYDYEDMQTRISVKRGSQTFTELFNAHAAEAFGLELEALWQVGDRTTINASLSLSDSEFTDFCGPVQTENPDGSTGCVNNWAQPGIAYDPSGHPITQFPETQGALNVSHDIPLANGGNININGTWAYVGEIEYSVFYLENTRAPSYNRLDLVAGYSSPSNRYQVLLFGKNVTDSDRPTVVGEDGPLYGPIKWSYYSYPALYGVELRVNW